MASLPMTSIAACPTASADHRVDLAGHDRLEPACTAGRRDLAEPGARARRQQPEIGRDLEQVDGMRLEDAGHLDEGVGVLGGVHQVLGPRQPEPGLLAQLARRRGKYSRAARSSPVPMAVPPRLTTRSRSSHLNTRQRSRDIASAQAENSAPRVIGQASCNSVRPIFTTSANSRSLGLERRLQRGDRRLQPAQQRRSPRPSARSGTRRWWTGAG